MQQIPKQLMLSVAAMTLAGLAIASPMPVAIYHSSSVNPSNTAHGRLYDVLCRQSDLSPAFITNLSMDTLHRQKALILWNEKVNVAGEAGGVNSQAVANIRAWVQNGGGLLCYNDSVGFEQCCKG